MDSLICSISTGGIICIAVCLILITILAVMLNRALQTKKQPLNHINKNYNINLHAVCEHLAGAIRIPTVSPKFDGDNDEAFFAYQQYLETTYPLIHTKCESTIVNKHALILHIKGNNSDMLPIAFLAHQDVVPATESNWEYPPFEGRIVNKDNEEYLYGRGTMDMKGQMISMLEGVEYLLKNNFNFKRDLYLCFGYDEELTGQLGAAQIVNYLKENNIQLEFLVDEGGVVLDGEMLGIDGKIALIGNSEKGYIDFALTATRDGGHSSAPVHPTSLEVLAKAIAKLHKHPMPSRWTQSTIELFHTLAPHMNFLFKFICVNRKTFSFILKWAIGKINPAVEAVIRTTMAPTKITGSDANNTISATATVNINCRLLKGDTDVTVKKYIEKIVGKDITVTIQPDSSYDAPSEVSSPDTESYQIIARSISETFEKLIPAPFTFIAGSDAKFYYPVCKHIYRFSPFPIDQTNAGRIHNANERIATKEIIPAVNFFINCIINANK